MKIIVFWKKHTTESLKKISNNSSGENNPNYNGKLQTPEYMIKQVESNSKTPLLVIDTFTNETFTFINSKAAANFIGCLASNIRLAKMCNYRVRRRYIIKDMV